MRKNKHPEHPLVIVRKEIGLTQEALAEILDVTPNYLSMIVNGKRPKSRPIAEKIHEKYGYSIDWILGESLYKTDEEALLYAIKTFDNPLEYEKEWIRSGGGEHPLNNLITVEARIAVALEKLNENGWRVAVDMIESLTKLSDFQNKEQEDK